MNVYVKAEAVSLELPLDLVREPGGAGAGTLKAALGSRDRLYRRILSDIDFQAVEGDRIGLLGLNGAGKTTLLRVLNGAFPPTRGRVDLRGSTQSLLNPTLGFDEQATVVENVFLRGTAMGLRRRQLKTVLDEILAFAGLAEKAGHPLHTLSAGQRMRLGFAISTAIQPDILFMDEWLSTGDAAFLERAQQRMRSRFHGSRIVFLASHSPAFLRMLCNKAIVLDAGRMRYFGDVDGGIADYRDVVARASDELRAELPQNDPLLFGDCTGVVERIRLAGPLVEIHGWAVTEGGAEVGALSVAIAGEPQHFDEFDRVDRDDVRAYLDRRSGRFGFRVVAKLPAGATIENPRESVAVSVGRSRQRIGAPLPYAHGSIVERVR